jgi:Transposase IS66 family
MKIELPPIPDEQRTPLVVQLLAIIDLLVQRVTQLEETVQQLRDEIAVLKGQKAKPQIAPSRLEPPPRPPLEPGQKRPGSAKRAKTAELTIHEEVPLAIPDAALPVGAVLIGYEPYVVQELILQTKNTRYLRARYRLPDGTTLLAPLPPDVPAGSHYGAGLISYILDQYHHNHVTQPLLGEQLHDFGIDISAGQLSHILTEDQEGFHQEKAELLTAGLATATYIGVDDTGARHQGHNGFCTVIGNDLFAYFESTDTKSRLNFLQVLRGTHTGYVINETTLAYWKRQKLAQAVVQQLCQDPQQLRFADEPAWRQRLHQLGIRDERHVRFATEGALLGCLIDQGVSPHLVVLSDGAPQFDILVHASCWIHAERPLARMIPYSEPHRQAIENARDSIWQLYQDLKAYQQQADPAQQPSLEARFVALVDQQTGFPSIDGVLREMRDRQADLLRVLAQPVVPLHNNGGESAIRDYVKKRKISGSTRSAAGRRARDTFASIKKTCRKLGIKFWDYLQDRVRGLNQIPSLAELIRQRAAEKHVKKAEVVPS